MRATDTVGEAAVPSLAPVGLRLIGAGFGRTGTYSIKAALEQLGLNPCYHMAEIAAHREHLVFWERAAAGKPVDWRELFAGYQAAVDWPAAAVYRQLMDVYPDAKVLLTVRDPERWYTSISNTALRTRRILTGAFITDVLRRRAPRFGTAVSSTIEEVIWYGLFGGGRWAPFYVRHWRTMDVLVTRGIFGGSFDKARAIAIFERHIEEVKRIVPADRLLVYNVREGWPPLCAFLGVPIPEGQPFPHLNDQVEWNAMIRKRVNERFSSMGSRLRSWR